MTYYVTADPHGYTTLLKKALAEKGFFDDPNPHKLIICGDLLDRGREPLEMQSFILDLLERNEVILIRGNHEDLLLDLLDPIHLEEDRWGLSVHTSHHVSNGTWGTALALAQMSEVDALTKTIEFSARLRNCPFIKTIVPQMRNYYETKNHIFVHGWLPTDAKRVQYNPDWRDAPEFKWAESRWRNGIKMHRAGIREPHKTIVCGHWNASHGHYLYGSAPSEFHDGAIHTPFYADGIISLDACTAASGIVNVIQIDDEEI